MKSIIAIIALLILAPMAACLADTAATPSDPVEVVRAAITARKAGGDWRTYLSKRLQNVITPAVEEGMRVHERNKGLNIPSNLDWEVKDVTVERATETTAIAKYTACSADGKTSKPICEYLVKEDDRWVMDSIYSNMLPDWAVPADIKPIRDEITKVLRQLDAALYDDQGYVKQSDPQVLEEFAKANLSTDSLKFRSASAFAEKYSKLTKANSPQKLSPVYVDITGINTSFGKQCAGVIQTNICARHNSNGEMELGITSSGLQFVKEVGKWKWQINEWSLTSPSTAPPSSPKPSAVPPTKLLPPLAGLPVELRHNGNRGGIYFDDILLTNDGKAVFFDDFQSGNLSDWSNADDAKVECSGSASKACCLYLNQRGPVVSEAFHGISIMHPGVVELSAWVWLPPAKEQKKLTFTNLNLYSGDDDSIGVGVEVDRQQKGYLITLHWNRCDGDNKDAASKGSVLKPGKWARIALRLDRGSEKASALLNGVVRASFHYSPSNFQAIADMSVWGWLGSGKK